MVRRHRIDEATATTIYPILAHHLAYGTIDKPSKDHPDADTERTFKLWWRIQRHSVGQPCYPEPMTYGAIYHHVSQSIQLPQEFVGQPAPPFIVDDSLTLGIGAGTPTQEES